MKSHLTIESRLSDIYTNLTGMNRWSWYSAATMKYLIAVFTEKYFDFNGRASRSEFWYAHLFYFIILIPGIFIITFPVGFILGVLGASATVQGLTGLFIGIAVGLFAAIPFMALMVRRLHDVGKSGWWYFISLVPFVGIFILLYFLACKSEENENRFGPVPVVD